jgi:hypothetical protein
MNRLSSSLALLLLLAPAVSAGTLQKNRIPAGARWLAHLDMEALKGSRIYSSVHAESAKNGNNELDMGLAQFKMYAGLDPTTDFKSVTVYCTTKSEKSTVALMSGNAQVDVALEKLRTLPNYHTTPAAAYLLHTWGSEHETWYGYVYRRQGSEERVVVASQDPDELVRGISILDNPQESLAAAALPAIRATPATGSILFAAAGESLNGLGDVEPVSAVARLAKTIVLDVGEDRGALYAHVALDTRRVEDAQRVQQVLQGAVALVGLANNDEQHAEAHARLQHLVDALRFTVSDTRVDADFRYDAQALIGDLKSLDELSDKGDAAADGAKNGKKRHAKKHHEPKPDEDH